MPYIKRVWAFICLAVLLFAPAPALALPQAVTEVKPDPPPRNRQIIMLVVDGLQADSLTSGSAPNISGLGMAGVRAERVSAMPPDTAAARMCTILTGADPSDHGYNGGSTSPARRTIMSLMEARGIKTALVDGTGTLEKACGDISHKYPGPYAGDGEVIARAVDVIRTQKPFFTVVVLAGPGRQLALAGAGTKAYNESVTSADTEVGKFLRQLHTDGTYDATMLVVTGTTGRPPLVVKGSDFLAGSRLPPVCLKDIAPTLAYLYGIETPDSRGLIMWNALLAGAGRTESFMQAQRVRDLSTAYADAVDSAARLENEKILVQEEKSRLTRDKQVVEQEIQARENEIDRLNTIIAIMKMAGIAGLILFAAALLLEYRILKKRYLFFT